MSIIQLSKTDKMILDLLTDNCRLSLKDVSSKCKISKQAVSKRITFYKKSRLVTFVPLVDVMKLGEYPLYVYLKLRGIKKFSYQKGLEDLDKIIEFNWFARLFGDFDLALSLSYKNLSDLSRKLNAIFSVFGDFISDKKIFLINQHIISGFKFQGESKRVVDFQSCAKKVAVSKIDSQILALIKANGRFNYSDLAFDLNIEPRTVRDHIKKLETINLIRGYSLFYNYSNFGFTWNTCILELSPAFSVKRLINFLFQEKRIPFISISIDKQIIFDYISEDPHSIRDLLIKIKTNFDSNIRNYYVFDIDKSYRKLYSGPKNDIPASALE